MTNDKRIEATKEWLLCSGIQVSSGPNRGAFNSWYDIEKKSYSYAYSEITGYGITTLLYLKNLFENEEYIERAKLAANWLMSKAAHSNGGVRTRDYYLKGSNGAGLYSFESDMLYSFDNAMVLYGLINLYKITKEKRYLDYALKLSNFLITRMRKPNGLFFAVLDAKQNVDKDTLEKWSSQSGSFHAKLALSFTDLFDITKDEAYKDAVFALCEACMGFQEPNGRFITSKLDNSTHLHPHSYSAEGLLYTGMYFDKQEFLASALRAVKWALDNQRGDGGIPKKFDGKTFVPYHRSDILAQILRLSVILHSTGKLGSEYSSKIEKLYNRLSEYQYLEKSGQYGGFFYGATLDGKRPPHINSWCSFFALQALVMYKEFYLNKRKMERMECFV